MEFGAMELFLIDFNLQMLMAREKIIWWQMARCRKFDLQMIKINKLS